MRPLCRVEKKSRTPHTAAASNATSTNDRIVVHPRCRDPAHGCNAAANTCDERRCCVRMQARAARLGPLPRQRLRLPSLHAGRVGRLLHTR